MGKTMSPVLEFHGYDHGCENERYQIGDNDWHVIVTNTINEPHEYTGGED